MEKEIQQLKKRIEELERNKIGVIMTDNTDMNVLRSLQRALTTNSLSVGSSSPVSCALIDLSSITKGLVFPRMTTTQRNAVVNPVAGLVIYNTTTNKLNVYTTAWEAITSV